jgi:hypothetical protein
METVALIASGISALAVISTSLRALGKSRERSGLGRRELKRMLAMYLGVSLIWLFLSIIFISPVVIKRLRVGEYLVPSFCFLALLFLFFILSLIWKRIFSSGS